MTILDIEQLIKEKNLPDQPDQVDWRETHTAWVLLTEQYAYKIKKPVQFSFLDFSTLARRRFYCNQELALNHRLAPDVYLKVLPINRYKNKLHIGERKGETIDYCLLMKRMDNAKEMNQLLLKDMVGEKDVQAIAEQLAVFHQNAEQITWPFNEIRLKKDFADIQSVSSVVSDHLGDGAGNTLNQAVSFANAFINKHLARFEWRQQKGYVRDVHGDLHSGNIFLLDKPVIFDCIEFNSSFRQIDLLNEIAFLCMDLDFHEKPELSDSFLKAYLGYLPCILNKEDKQLLLFYKWYRAGIRLKINCLGLHKGMDNEEKKKAIQQIQQYYHLFEKYFQEIRNPAIEIIMEPS